MTTMLAISRQQGLRVCIWLGACILAASAFAAQAPAPRIPDQFNSSDVTPLAGTLRPFALPQNDAGRLPADSRMTGMTIVFNRTPAQQAALDKLILDQQNPASPLYHQWLTPEQFGARFGVAQADIEKVEQWLQQQGFSIDSVGRSSTMIHFSGTVNQVELAFQTQMHYYNVGGQKLVAPSALLSIPSAIAPTIDSIRDVSTIRPRSMHIPISRMNRPKSQYTFWGGDPAQQYVLFAPGDIRVAYDMNTLLNTGFHGEGQTIAVMGQSEISVTDIENFQNAAGLSVKDPTLIVVPGDGSPAFSSGDEGESDLDVEWSGAMAPGANIVLVYTGDSQTSNGVYDSISYAVDSKIGDIITISYGTCEPELAGFNIDSSLQQAATQGQTVIAASGDEGSTECLGYSNLSTAIQEADAVNYPSSSPYVTGLGGTEISSADDVVGTYWGPAPSETTITLTSALNYIPEVAWNDDSLSGPVSPTDGGGLSASGGGESTLYPQPSWQTSYFTATGETNPSSSHRLVPDIALYSSPNYPGYLYCTSDQSDWSSGQEGSCGNNEFYDPVTYYFNIAGGTSFAAPIFAGMTAVINQKVGYTHGQGLLNPTLYSLASVPATYSTAFHDVTTGNNDCTAGTLYGYCSASGATTGFAAGIGYDMVTGLGSVDLTNLATAWTTSGSAPAASTLIGTTTTLSAQFTAPAANTADNVTITVASDTGSTTPTGSVSVSVNGGAATSYTLTSDGTYVLPETFTSAGTFTIVAQYLGDGTHDISTGAITVTVGGTSTGTGSFTLTATNVSVAQGSTGDSTATVTPAGGYEGTVTFGLETSSSALQTYGCYDINNAVVTGTGAVTATVELLTSETLCESAISKRTMRRFVGAAAPVAKNNPGSGLRKVLPVSAAALAGVLLFGLRRRRANWLTMLGCFVLLGLASLAVGCGGGNSSGSGGSSTTGDVPTGTYSLSIVGNDTVNSSITASANFTLTVTAQ